MNCLLEVALKERGTREVPGRLDNARIVEYLKTTTYPIPAGYIDEIPWCSAFINWCCKQCGIEGTDSAGSQSWLDWGIETDGDIGDIIIFKWNSHGHVALIKDITEDGIYCLGGNQKNSVCISFFSYNNVVGYRRAA